MGDNDGFENIYSGDEVQDLLKQQNKELLEAKETIANLKQENSQYEVRLRTMIEQLVKTKQQLETSVLSLTECMSEKSKLQEENEILRKTCLKSSPQLKEFLHLIEWRSSLPESHSSIEDIQAKITSAIQIELQMQLSSELRNSELASSAIAGDKQSQQLNKSIAENSVKSLLMKLRVAESERDILAKNYSNLINQMKTKEFFIKSSCEHLENLNSASEQDRRTEIKAYIQYVQKQLQAISQTNNLGIQIKVIMPTQ